jgi:1,2-diacylglycerol 3-alpha-glucosyltransferase
MKIAIASSGLGHISRGIETWAADLAAALHQRGEAVILCKGGGQVAADYERLISCVQRDSPRAKKILKWMPKNLTWHIGMAEAYQLEQTSFARNLIPVLRREQVDILHVQDQWLALHIQRARKLGLVKARSILGHGTEESLKFIAKIDYLQHLAPWHLEQAKAAGVWKPTWTAIPNFIDTDRFNPAGGNLREELGIPRAARGDGRSVRRRDQAASQADRLSAR